MKTVVAWLAGRHQTLDAVWSAAPISLTSHAEGIDGFSCSHMQLTPCLCAHHPDVMSLGENAIVERHLLISSDVAFSSPDQETRFRGNERPLAGWWLANGASADDVSAAAFSFMHCIKYQCMPIWIFLYGHAGRIWPLTETEMMAAGQGIRGGGEEASAEVARRRNEDTRWAPGPASLLRPGRWPQL